MTNLINDNLMQMARPGARSHAPIPTEIQRWKDGGGASRRDERRPAMLLIDLFVAARNALIDGRRRRCVYDALMALDDRSLADIGMHRSQIPAIVDAMYEGAKLRPVAAPALSPPARRLVTGHR